MTEITNALFTALLTWVRAFAAWLWAAVTGEEGLLAWIGEHWKTLALLLIAAGTVADLAVYLLRWRPYRVWASFIRRMRRRFGTQEAEEAAVPAEEPLPPAGPGPEPAARARRSERHAPGLTQKLRGLLVMEDAEESHMHLKRIEPLTRPEDAYNEPYIPPQWKEPVSEPNGIPVRHRRAGRHQNV